MIVFLNKCNFITSNYYQSVWLAQPVYKQIYKLFKWFEPDKNVKSVDTLKLPDSLVLILWLTDWDYKYESGGTSTGPVPSFVAEGYKKKTFS